MTPTPLHAHLEPDLLEPGVLVGPGLLHRSLHGGLTGADLRDALLEVDCCPATKQRQQQRVPQDTSLATNRRRQGRWRGGEGKGHNRRGGERRKGGDKRREGREEGGGGGGGGGMNG